MKFVDDDDDDGYCTQLFHRLCCNTFQKTGIYANIHRRPLLSTGKIERLYALVLVSHIQ